MVVEVRQAGGLVRLVVATSGGQGTPLMELFASHPSLHRIDCSPVRERQWGKFRLKGSRVSWIELKLGTV